eukprot:306832_1
MSANNRDYLKLLDLYKDKYVTENIRYFEHRKTTHIHFKRKSVHILQPDIKLTTASIKMLTTLGLYSTLVRRYAYSAPSGKFNKELVQCILATEQYKIYYDLVQYLPNYSFTLKDIKYLSICLVESRHIKNGKFCDWSGKRRNSEFEDLKYFISSHVASLAHFLRNQLCKPKKQEYLQFVYSFYYGYLMLFCTDMICKKNKKLKPLNIKFEGARRMENAGHFIKDQYDPSQNSDISTYPFTAYMTAKLYVEQKKFDSAIEEYVFCFAETSECIIRALTLRDLSDVCFKSKKYLLGLKALHHCYKLCNGYMLPSFTKKGYKIRKKKLKLKWTAQKCIKCGLKSKSMKCCSACLITPYCSLKCQTKHWSSEHSKKCTGNWQNIYHIFRDNLRKSFI